MKLNSTKSVIFRPLLLGSLGLLVGGGLFVYYYFFNDDTSVAAYVINGIIFFAGVVGVLSTIYVAIIQYLKIQTKNKGDVVIAHYVSHKTDTSFSKVDYYKITYKYELNGVEVIKTSSSEFDYKEALTLKCVQDFQIRVLNGREILDCDLTQMFNENKDAIKELEDRYNKAQDAVNKIINS